MFKFVHYVHYLVRDRDKMVAYMDRNFGMKPQKLEHAEDLGTKNALYSVGQTLIEFTEPTKPGTNSALFLKKNGPGVYHVAWGVEQIDQVAQDLVAKGNSFWGKQPVDKSPHGYYTANIDPKDSLDIWFQLSEDTK